MEIANGMRLAYPTHYGDDRSHRTP
jgi:hypothetical protein